MNVHKIASKIAGDVIPIEKHEKFRTKEQRDTDEGLVEVDSPGFRFKTTSPDPELLEHYERNGIDPSPKELEAIQHIKQLSDALSKGHIGFEWFTSHLKQELDKVGSSSR